ncbi:MAG TPA: hypothetical protein VF746_28430 [Longimicrobium sp.]
MLELVVLELARRTHDSWVLLLGAALLIVPLVATDRTLHWLGRAPRKRWKRHDVEAGLAQPAEPAGGEARAGRP